jgi:tRNA (guanine37-N1)-methyltransferase
MKISIITLFPEMFQGPFDFSIVKRAIEKNLIEVNIVNLRSFGLGKHQVVDDTPYGGGDGMVLRVDVLEKAIESVKTNLNKDEEKVILLAAHGKTFDQALSQNYSKLKHLIIVCGHYEGVDERIKEYIDEEVSVGDYILTGGEIPAMLITDSVARLVDGVIKKGSSANESFSPFLEHPHYTKPQTFNNSSVPGVLLSGNHKEIEDWRNKKSLEVTKKLRPDLLKKS